MKRTFSLVIAVVVVVAVGSAFGASDGTYTPAHQHCSGAADNAVTPDRVEDGCHSFTITVSDLGGHEYFGIGTPQTIEGEQGVVPNELPFGLFANVHELEWWYDFGDGCTRYSADFAAPGAPAQSACPWFNPTAPNYDGPSPAPDPSKGLMVYFGADDNLAGGEHDSSYLINNGPSDGGGIHVVLNPAQAEPWFAALMAADQAYLLTHPLPLGDAGIGFCADSICISVQTQRQVVYQGGNTTPGAHRDVANYSGKRWDPANCSGANSMTSTACDDPATTETIENITYWHDMEGAVYAEPGVQFYADPDPQGSPIGPYPLPALYVGTCGIIIGGGPRGQMPASDFTDPATGQIVIPTGCD